MCFGDQVKYVQDKCPIRLNLNKMSSHRTLEPGEKHLLIHTVT